MTKEKTFRKSINYIQDKLDSILEKVSDEDIKKIKKLFLDADRIFLYGAGRSGLVAKAFAIRLVHLGFQAFVIGETITAPVRKGDLVLVISGTGTTIPVVMTAQIANDLGAEIVSITANKKSELIQYSDVSLVIKALCKEKERKKFAPLGTLFESSALILLDGIVADLMSSKEETEESMRKRHATLE